MNRTSWTLYSGNELSFGRGARHHLERVLRNRRIERAVVVADENLVQAGIVDKVAEVWRRADCQAEVYLGTVEPSSVHAEELVDLANRIRPTAWLGLGGGSNMDLAKLACAAFTHQQPPVELFGYDAVPGPLNNLICLPTTAGTGSEVSHAAIVKHAGTGRKTPVLSQFVRPEVAIVDPELSDSCPTRVSAESGIDALTHALEAYLAREYSQLQEDTAHGLPYEGSHFLSDLYAARAIELIGAHLVRAIQDPSDTVARDAMALASTLAGIAFSSAGVTLVHALEYWVGDRYPCSHGVGNGILLPEVLAYYLPAREARLKEVAGLLGVSDPTPTAAIERVRHLRHAVGLPESLSEVGGQACDLPGLASSAAGLERLLQLAPRATTEQDLLQILQASL